MVEVIINYWAVLACGVASFIFGFLWYGPLFGKQYMRMQGVSAEEAAGYMKDPAKRRIMMRNYVLTFMLALVTAFALAHSLIFASSYLGVYGAWAGVQAGFWSWLGFVLPATTNLVFFDKKHWDWWFLVNGYYLIQLVGMGLILSLWV